MIAVKPRAAASAALLASLTLATPLPALAAYCGAPADAAAVQALVVARGPSDSSRIMDIVVVQDYARVDIETKGRLTEYYAKDCGHWRYVGTALPPEAPGAVQTQLDGFVPRDDGGTKCVNPGYVNHPSAP